MRPLQAIGTGLVLVVLTAPAGGAGVDLFADPVGWLLVLLGVPRLPSGVPLQRVLLVTAVLATLVAAVLWVPATASSLDNIDPSLQWSLELPRVGFLVALSLALARAADVAADARARGWWRMVSAAASLTGLLPVVVYGASVRSLADVAGGVAIGTLLSCLVLCFLHAARPWADADVDRRAPSGD